MSGRVHPAPGITIDPEIMGGAECISGTRIPASTVRDLARAGFPVTAIIDEYPDLTPDQIADALAWQSRSRADRSAAIAFVKAIALAGRRRARGEG